MKLIGFHVQNFRSVADSGYIKVGHLTALVGRNESGKSNLLQALHSLNPPGGRKALSPIKDFPRDRRLDECTDQTPVVSTRWELTEAETNELMEILGGDNHVTEVEVGRRYGKTNVWVSLSGAKAPVVADKDVKAVFRRLDPVITAEIGGVPDDKRDLASAAWEKLKGTSEDVSDPKAWASGVEAAAVELRKAFGQAGIILGDAADEVLSGLEEKASAVTGYDAAYQKAINMVADWLPRFIYVADFPELNGHQDIDNFIQRRSQGIALSEAEENFQKLAKVADFSPKQLHSLRQSGDHETRNQLLNRAGALVSKEIRRLWKDRSLKVRFNIDGAHLDTLISDPNSTYDVEVNLDDRSRGFRWFFSFYISFAADTDGGEAQGAILLLDEPGLYLHAKSQEDLLRHFRQDFENQIIYTTHSPFMIPPEDLSVVRTVNITQEAGTTVTNDPTGDSRTLFPLQAALGYQVSQTLFIGPANLVVEGITDFWILSSVSSYLRSLKKTALPEDMVITPVGGAGKVSYMVALLSSQQLSVLVLLDDERAGREAQKELVASRLVRDSAVMFVSEAFSEPREADIEDLIDPAVYEELVHHTYSKELKGKKLTPNNNVPRIVKRFEMAFTELGLEFNKTRPAREFLTRMATEPDKMVTITSLPGFVALFEAINRRYGRMKPALAAE